MKNTKHIKERGPSTVCQVQKAAAWRSKRSQLCFYQTLMKPGHEIYSSWVSQNTPGWKGLCKLIRWQFSPGLCTLTLAAHGCLHGRGWGSSGALSRAASTDFMQLRPAPSADLTSNTYGRSTYISQPALGCLPSSMLTCIKQELEIVQFRIPTGSGRLSPAAFFAFLTNVIPGGIW